jgi:hypothetical protein
MPDRRDVDDLRIAREPNEGGGPAPCRGTRQPVRDTRLRSFLNYGVAVMASVVAGLLTKWIGAFMGSASFH